MTMGENLVDAGNPAARGRHRSRKNKDAHCSKRKHRDNRDEDDVLLKIRKKRGRSHSTSSSSSSPISPMGPSSESLQSLDSSDEERRRERKREKSTRKRYTRTQEDEFKDRKATQDKSEKRSQRAIFEKHDSETKLTKKAKRRLKKLKHQEASYSKVIQASGWKVENISADDYFLKSSEFASWLKEACDIYFSDLSSKETHKLFETFVEKWNAGRLHTKYYDGIKQAPRTSYNWAIKKGPGDSANVEECNGYTVSTTNGKFESKKFRTEKQIRLDKLSPKPMVMGGGGEFHGRLAKESTHKEKKQLDMGASYNERRLLLETKEAAAMKQMQAFVNSAGEKITIAKRH